MILLGQYKKKRIQISMSDETPFPIFISAKQI